MAETIRENLQKLNNKKLLPILVVILIVVILLLIWSFLQPASFDVETRLPPSPTPKVINPEGDTLIYDSKEFQIVYIPAFQRYVITILAAPFDGNRTKAEQYFLQLLDTNQVLACALNAVVTTPNFANPEESGAYYPLSFCVGASPTNVLPPINPNASALTPGTIYPAQGTVAMGGTSNSIFIDFPQSVDPKTAVVETTPTIGITSRVHPRKKNQLTLVPQSTWQPNTIYTLRIKAGLLSADKSAQLKEDIVLEYSVTQAEFSDYPDAH